MLNVIFCSVHIEEKARKPLGSITLIFITYSATIPHMLIAQAAMLSQSMEVQQTQGLQLYKMVHAHGPETGSNAYLTRRRIPNIVLWITLTSMAKCLLKSPSLLSFLYFRTTLDFPTFSTLPFYTKKIPPHSWFFFASFASVLDSVLHCSCMYTIISTLELQHLTVTTTTPLSRRQWWR